MSGPAASASPPDILGTNLAALTPATRAALAAVAPTIAAQLGEHHGQLCVRTADTRWVPVQTSSDPVGAADALLSRLDAQGPPPVIIVVGLGLGSMLEAIERRGSPTRVLAIEPVPALALAMMARRDWTPWLSSGRLRLLVGPTYDGAAEAWKFLTGGTPPVVVAPLMEREFAVDTARAKAVAQHAVNGAASNERARKAFAGRYLRNTLTNIATIATEGDAASLFDRFAGVPAIVVAAGPSLDHNLAVLRQQQERALIIAVDTASRPLLAGGVTPHLVVGIDPSDLNARHLVGLPDTRGMYLVGEASLDPAVFPAFAQRTFSFKVSTHQPWPWLGEHGFDRGRLDAWGSVLTTAFDLAVRAGCNPIVFAGADLAYTRGLQYCRNTVYEPDWRHLVTDEERAEVFLTQYLSSRKHARVRGITGDEVITAPHFVQFRDWLVARAQSSGRQVFNATGGGILQGGTIRQVEFASLDWPPLPPAHADLRASVRAAWLDSTAPRPLDVLARELSSTDTLPLATWLEFGGDTATAQQVSDAVAESSAQLSEEYRVRQYLAHLRESYDRRASSLEAAQELSHGGYDTAARRAYAQQAHLITDFVQRTYDVQASGQRPSTTDVLEGLALPRTLRALDVGCGTGRSMVPLVDSGMRVDGVDISERMLHFARQNPALQACQFFLGSGDDLGDAPDGAYDLVYSQLVFRYITARTVRNRLLRAIARALRPGGVVLVEMRFFPETNAAAIEAPNVPWSADHYGTMAEGGAADVRPTPDELHLVHQDFARYFDDLRLQFVDMPASYRTTHAPHLIVSGAVNGTLWDRMR